MHSLIVTPGRSIGPLTLGMSPDEILETLSHLRHIWDPQNSREIAITKGRDEDDFYWRYQDGFSFFMVRYQQERAVEIGLDHYLRDQLPITLCQMDVFQTTAEELVKSLKRHSPCVCDSEDEQLGYNYVFPNIGVRLWRENCFHPKLLLDSKYMQGLWHMVDELKKNLYFDIVAVRRQGDDSSVLTN